MTLLNHGDVERRKREKSREGMRDWDEHSEATVIRGWRMRRKCSAEGRGERKSSCQVVQQRDVDYTCERKWPTELGEYNKKR